MKTWAVLRGKHAHAIDDCRTRIPRIVINRADRKEISVFLISLANTLMVVFGSLYIQPTGHSSYFAEFRRWSILNVSLCISKERTLKLPTLQQNLEYEIILKQVFHPILVQQNRLGTVANLVQNPSVDRNQNKSHKQTNPPFSNLTCSKLIRIQKSNRDHSYTGLVR